MESRAILRFNGLPANKMRAVADLVRGRDVPVALHTLQFVTRAAALPMRKLIQSAVANAREKSAAGSERFDPDALFVKKVIVGEGPTAKRFRPRAQGRAYRIRKRSCHVWLELEAHKGAAAPRSRRVAKAAAAKAAPPVVEAAKGRAKKGKEKKAAAAAK
jgi:large subunit ribosomal protein L22